MSEKQIPERYRYAHDGPSLLTINDTRRCIEELGTAESLVRDLALYVSHRGGSACMGNVCACGLKELLSRIPKELRSEG